jgi:hypothetical protein
MHIVVVYGITKITQPFGDSALGHIRFWYHVIRAPCGHRPPSLAFTLLPFFSTLLVSIGHIASKGLIVWSSLLCIQGLLDHHRNKTVPILLSISSVQRNNEYSSFYFFSFQLLFLICLSDEDFCRFELPSRRAYFFAGSLLTIPKKSHLCPCGRTHKRCPSLTCYTSDLALTRIQYDTVISLLMGPLLRVFDALPFARGRPSQSLPTSCRAGTLPMFRSHFTIFFTTY